MLSLRAVVPAEIRKLLATAFIIAGLLLATVKGGITWEALVTGQPLARNLLFLTSVSLVCAPARDRYLHTQATLDAKMWHAKELFFDKCYSILKLLYRGESIVSTRLSRRACY